MPKKVTQKSSRVFLCHAKYSPTTQETSEKSKEHKF